MRSKLASQLMAVAALIAVGIYSIRCKPAWSPEGDRVAYIYSTKHENKETWGIAICDVGARKSRSILQVTEDTSEDGGAPAEVLWPKRGEDLICVSLAEKGRTKDGKEANSAIVSKVNVRTGERARIIDAPTSDSLESLGFVCPAVLDKDRWIWIRGEDASIRLDLKRKEATVTPGGSWVFGESGKVRFVRPDPDGSIVFGKMSGLFSRKEKDLFKLAGTKDGKWFRAPVAAAPAKKKRFALLEAGNDSKTLALLTERGKVVREILLPRDTSLPPLGEETDFAVLQGAWHPEGNLLWFVAEFGGGAEEKRVGIAEIDVETGIVRRIELDEAWAGDKASLLQMSLSPDARHLALSILRSEDRVVLGLVDLAAEKPTIVPIDLPAGDEAP
jgi:hypothetical protein